MKRTIIIMAKVPAAGTVKTRLHSILSPAQCAALARAFLQDTLKKAQNVCKKIILAYAPAAGRGIPENILSPGIALIEQTGADLGERMANAFEFALAEDSAVVMIGTDSPTFPASNLTLAFEALEKDAEIILGKSTDGGFYLIGLRKSFPKLFDRIEWSTPRVFEQITENIKDMGINNLELVPEHYDVDTPEDFLKMKDEIFGNETLQKSAQKTYQWLLADS